MIPIWLAAIMVLGIAIGIVAIVLMVCYGFVGILFLKDKLRRKK